jgi:hypothetical protein
MKKSTHSKIKNTVILFELLTRQVAADTIKGVENSPALGIIKEFFKADSILAKELVLYQTLVTEKYNNTDKADYLINTVTKLRNKLNKKTLSEQKYNLIREVKKHYELQDFFKTGINDYKLYASIYRIFEGVSIAKVTDVVKSRYVVMEHLTRKTQSRLSAMTGAFLQKGYDLGTAQLMATKALDGAVTRQSMLLSYMDNFWIVGAFFICCIPLLLMQRRAKSNVKISAADAH